jgi:cation diffusion facilitator family transporter
MNIVRKTALLSIATGVVTLTLKFGAFFITGSIGLFSDALESFINIISGVLVFSVLSIANIPADKNHNYGHDKAEYFAAGVEGVLIVMAAIAIIYTATIRLLHPVSLTNILPALTIAIIATATNLATACFMLKVARKYDSIALEADAKHLLTDVWTTLCVLVGLVIIFIAPPKWQILDPIIAIIVALNIITTGIKLLRRAIDGLMDISLPARELTTIEGAITSNLPAEGCFQELRTRKAGPKRFIEFKLLLPGNITVFDSHQICDNIESEIGNCFNSIYVTIHVEPLNKSNRNRNSNK